MRIRPCSRSSPRRAGRCDTGDALGAAHGAQLLGRQLHGLDGVAVGVLLAHGGIARRRGEDTCGLLDLHEVERGAERRLGGLHGRGRLNALAVVLGGAVGGDGLLFEVVGNGDLRLPCPSAEDRGLCGVLHEVVGDFAVGGLRLLAARGHARPARQLLLRRAALDSRFHGILHSVLDDLGQLLLRQRCGFRYRIDDGLHGLVGNGIGNVVCHVLFLVIHDALDLLGVLVLRDLVGAALQLAGESLCLLVVVGHVLGLGLRDFLGLVVILLGSLGRGASGLGHGGCVLALGSDGGQHRPALLCIELTHVTLLS